MLVEAPTLETPATEATPSFADRFNTARNEGNTDTAQTDTPAADQHSPIVPDKKAPEAKPEAKPAKKSAADAAFDEPEVKQDEPEYEPPAEITKDNAKENWSKSRELIGKYRDELKELRAKVTEASKAPANTIPNEEVEKLRAELADKDKIIRSTALERHPEFRSKYIEGVAETRKKLAQDVADYGGNAEGFISALQSTGKARIEALENAFEGMPTLAKEEVMTGIRELTILEREKAALLSDAEGSHAKFIEQEQAQTRERDEARIKENRAEFDKVASEIPTLKRAPDDAEGAEEWNKGIDEARQYAEKLLFDGRDIPFTEYAAAAYWRKEGPRVLTLLKAERTARRNAESELAKVSAAEPGAGRAGAGSGGAATPQTFAERFAAARGQ